MFLFDPPPTPPPPENIRKRLMFSGGSKGNIGKKKVKECSNFLHQMIDNSHVLRIAKKS